MRIDENKEATSGDIEQSTTITHPGGRDITLDSVEEYSLFVGMEVFAVKRREFFSDAAVSFHEGFTVH